MSRCKNCLCFDEKHLWCLMGGKCCRPNDGACEWFVEIPSEEEVKASSRNERNYPERHAE